MLDREPAISDRMVFSLRGERAGDGALHPGIPGREPTAAKARQEIRAVEATALGNGGGIWLKTKNVTIIGLTLSI
jgi:hypothetical protein